MATTSTLYGLNASNDRFDAEAQTWDSNPFVRNATNEAYKAIIESIPIFRERRGHVDVLELGCGTGLLSLQMARHARQLVAVDAAAGMIRVLGEKLQQPDAPDNVTPVCTLLDDPEDKSLPAADPTRPDGPRVKFDVVTSHLVLHHIPKLEPVFRTLFGCLKSGGQLALTDFEDFGPEAKKFHPQSRLDSVERHGISAPWVANLLTNAGFVDVSVAVAWSMKKRVETFEGEFGEVTIQAEGDGQLMDFPFLLIEATKP